jgi:hypothetical protein
VRTNGEPNWLPNAERLAYSVIVGTAGRMLFRRSILPPLVALIASICIDAPSGLPAAPMPNFKQVAKSILSVSAGSCAGRKVQKATAFVWKNPDTVVTTLHNVAGCQSLSVTSGGRTWTATVTRISKKSDLALLTINGAPPFPALPESNAPADKGYRLWMWMPAQERLSPSDRRSITVNGSKSLRDFVSDNVARELEPSGIPGLDLNVYYASGLLIGASGSPVFDDSGAVAGVADGELNGGIVAVNWVTPARYLVDLFQSNENISDIADLKNLSQFRVDEPPARATITCGATTFSQTAGVDLAQALVGTYDFAGLNKIVNTFHVENPEPYLFDVYQDLVSGAAFALPKGAQLTAAPTGCKASFAENPITFEIETSHYKPDNVDDAIQHRRQFEDHALSAVAAGSWEPDYRWTVQPAPSRFDGFVAAREGWVRTLPGFPKPVENVFMASVIKGGTFLGITARAPSSYALAAEAQRCTQPPHTKNCLQLLQQMQSWGGAVIAVYLATFPVG